MRTPAQTRSHVLSNLKKVRRNARFGTRCEFAKPSSVPEPLLLALRILLVYSALVVGWQLVGIALRAADLPALGSSASPVVAFIALLFVAGFWWSARRVEGLLVALALVFALMAGLTLFNTLRADVDASLWPSPLFRYAGAAINALGVVGFIAAAVGYFRWRAA